jgi:hypothetical protein
MGPRRARVLLMALLCLLGTFLVVVAQPTASVAAAHHAVTHYSSTASSPSEGSPIADLDGTINGLGIFTYPDAYAGVTYANNATSLDVYVVASADEAALERAVQSAVQQQATEAGSSPIPVTFVIVPMSETSFTRAMRYLKGSASRADGINFVHTYLDASTDSLDVQLAYPTGADLVNLSHALSMVRPATRVALTTGNYLAGAGRLLQLKFGSQCPRGRRANGPTRHCK